MGLPPGRLPSGLQLIPETRTEFNRVNLAFTHASINRDDFANAAVAAIITAITGNGGSAA